jgi:hypothetical protein
MVVFSRTSLSTGDIFTGAAALIQRNVMLCGVGALLMFALKAGSDLGIRQWAVAGSVTAGLMGLVYMPVIGIVHYLLIARMMQAERLTDRGWSAGALLSFFGAYVLATIGMLFGIILLIIPGVILAIRWTIYGNFVIARGLAPVPAIKASWEATRGYGGTIFLALLVLGVCELPGIFIARGGFGAQAATTATVISGDIYTAVLGMIGLCVTTSIYALLVGPDHAHYTEVFA